MVKNLGHKRVNGPGQGVTGQEPGLEQVCLRLASSLWVLDFVQKRFHNMSPGDFEGMFIKAGGSETKDGLMVEEATRERLGSALRWLPGNLLGKG